MAIARILHASGAAEAIDKFEQDFDDLMAIGTVHLGIDKVSDDLLFEAISARARDFVTVDL